MTCTCIFVCLIFRVSIVLLQPFCMRALNDPESNVKTFDLNAMSSHSLIPRKEFYCEKKEHVTTSFRDHLDKCVFHLPSLLQKRYQHLCLFVLRFYGPVNPMGSCRARLVYLATRLLGRLSPLSG